MKKKKRTRDSRRVVSPAHAAAATAPAPAAATIAVSVAIQCVEVALKYCDDGAVLLVVGRVEVLLVGMMDICVVVVYSIISTIYINVKKNIPLVGARDASRATFFTMSFLGPFHADDDAVDT